MLRKNDERLDDADFGESKETLAGEEAASPAAPRLRPERYMKAEQREVKRSREKESALGGRRVIIIARQSETREGSQSIGDQLKTLREDIDAEGATYVDRVDLPGTTGSMPGRRGDLDRLLERREQLGDFDAIFLMLPDRLTRAGIDHAFSIIHEFRKLGVRFIFKDGHTFLTGETESEAIHLGFRFASARDAAEKTSYRTTGALARALADGRRTTGATPPYAVDKLVRDEHGVPKHILRLIGDGRQLRIHPKTRAVLETLGRRGGGADGHLTKGKTDTAEYVPGDARHVEVVRRIYTLRYVEGKRSGTIAAILNGEGIPARPTPQHRRPKWTDSKVRQVLENSVYCGLSVGNLFQRGLYHKMENGIAVPVDLPPELLLNAKSAPMFPRPPEDWVFQRHVRMETVLPPEIVRQALIDQDGHRHERWKSWERRRQEWEAAGRPMRRGRPLGHTGGGSRHTGSDYILSGILRADSGQVMVGVRTGIGAGKRYYRCRGAQHDTTNRARHKRLISATPLEVAVFDGFRELASRTPDLQRALTQMLREELDARVSSRSRLHEARQRVQAAEQAIDRVVENLDPTLRSEAERVLTRLKAERMEAADQVAHLERQAEQQGLFDPDALAADMADQFRRLGEAWHALPPAMSKQVAAALIASATADLDTRQVTIDLRLPEFETAIAQPELFTKREKPGAGAEATSDAPSAEDDAADPPSALRGPMCLVARPGTRTRDETHSRPIVGTITCVYTYRHPRAGAPSYTWRSSVAQRDAAGRALTETTAGTVANDAISGSGVQAAADVTLDSLRPRVTQKPVGDGVDLGGDFRPKTRRPDDFAGLPADGLDDGVIPRLNAEVGQVRQYDCLVGQLVWREGLFDLCDGEVGARTDEHQRGGSAV